MNRQRFNSYVKNQQFIDLFIDMGWNNSGSNDSVLIKNEDSTFRMECIAQRSGFKVFTCVVETIPLMTVVRNLDKRLRKSANDYILILISSSEPMHHEWIVPVKSLEKRVLVPVEYTSENQLDFLFSKLDDLSFGLTEKTSIIDVTKRVSGAFMQNSEKVTKDFYAGFSKQHSIFAGFVSGIELDKDKQWYVSVMLNRLMFCYFIQKKGFLDFDTNYLQNKLKDCNRRKGRDSFYKGFYKSFLTVLFHNGLNNPKHDDTAFIKEFGHIPYLNGGLFDDHYVEREYPDIDIKDEAFENLFEFFDKYHWHLDTRIEASGKDINPDVIGYIFEQYINDRAQMGAYYTKEDITNYIGKNCILPFLWNKVEKNAEANDAWNFLKTSGNKYIYDSVKKGIYDENGNITSIPENISTGLDTEAPDLLERRKDWNSKTPEQFGLPTEIWRETIERRNRFFDVLKRIKSGEIHSINDFITYNLDIIAFTQDFLQETDDERFISCFYHSMLELSVLDPTCGSGAFLFAAMNILEPLYDICIDRMEEFNKLDSSLFNLELSEINGRYRSNRPYFIYKTTILRNLYGVDIMPEAIEIAKLRLFLKMVAVVEADRRSPNLGLDPLPDIDFNIRCGNTLVGFANQKELFDDFEGSNADMFAVAEWEETIKKEVADVSEIYKSFRSLQLNQTEQSVEFKQMKKRLIKELDELNEVLNQYLYKKSVSSKTYEEWLSDAQPFHWFAEFYGIVSGNGGFDAIIGNPPYVEYAKVKKQYTLDSFDTLDCGNLYAYVFERCINISNNDGFIGMIVQLPIACTDRMSPAQKLLRMRNSWIETYDDRPGRLFDNLEHIRATIFITTNGKPQVYTTSYNRWYSEFRSYLFETIHFHEGKYVAGSFPKIGTHHDYCIFEKIHKKRALINSLIPSMNKLYYHNAPQYFIRCTDFIPLFERNGIRSTSIQIKEISTSNDKSFYSIGCVLNSSLFYWYFVLLSDCRHLNPREIQSFPFDPEDIKESSMLTLKHAYELLMSDYKKHANRKDCIYKATGRVIYDEFFPKYSKPIINEIDKALSVVYGLLPEELDYIINYDIKYRMGDEIKEEE